MLSFRMLSIVMLISIILSDVMLSVVILSVIMLTVIAPIENLLFENGWFYKTSYNSNLQSKTHAIDVLTVVTNTTIE
jgi:hypothetical protein